MKPGELGHFRTPWGNACQQLYTSPAGEPLGLVGNNEVILFLEKEEDFDREKQLAFIRVISKDMVGWAYGQVIPLEDIGETR